MSAFAILNRITGELATEPPPCVPCGGRCCTRKAGYKFVELTYRERLLEVYQPHLATHAPTGKQGFFFLPEDKGGACPFLTPAGSCGVYNDRPQTCRNFDCRCQPADAPFFDEMPELLTLIRMRS